MSELRQIVGDRIRALRKARGLTQQQLAELSNLDDAYIGSVERGESNISLDTLEKLVIALKIHPTELFLSTELNELKVIQREAIDEYTAILNTLTVNQIQSLRKINREIGKVLN